MYKLTPIQANIRNILIGLVIIIVGVVAMINSKNSSFLGIMLIFQVPIIMLVFGLFFTLSSVFAIPKVRSKQQLNDRRNHLSVLNTKILELLYNELNLTKDWRWRQEINLLISWLECLEMRKIYLYSIDDKSIFEIIENRIVNKKLFELLLFPYELESKNHRHGYFALWLFKIYREYNNNGNKYYSETDLETPDFFKESNSPYPLEYLCMISEYLYKWAMSEPNNYALQPPEAYRALVTIVFGKTLGV